MREKRLFIVSNRLPLNIETRNSDLLIRPSAGGLVTAINSFINGATSDNTRFSQTFWVGVPGCSRGVWIKAESSIPQTAFTYLPVFINKSIYDHYYKGFSNEVLWPLFHYFPSYAEFNSKDFEGYLDANSSFLNVILENAQPSDVIWIHDYHLLPLAEMVRREIPGITIGFFLHIPFPSYEIIRLMPRSWQEKIIRGMLGADLIGFHTVDYTAHFLECARMILGVDHEMNIMRYDDRLIKADIFPISIDYEAFNKACDDPAISNHAEAIKRKFSGKKIIFSVDRLDYTKGLSNRLRAYEYFLLNNADYHNNVVFILVVVPSRDTISKYAERKKMIDESISNINSKIGNVHWQPVIYQYNSLSFEEMMALYISCDVALITPMRDGMNLVAKEFVASRKDGQGVLILSELAGAARELTDALIINPNDTKEMAGKIRYAFEMGTDEQRRRMASMQARIKQYDVKAWAEDFLFQLKSIKKKQQDFQIKFLDEKTKLLIFEDYHRASHRLLLLDCEGILTSYTSLPLDASPGGSLFELLEVLSSCSKNEIYIISGRDSTTLEKWFGALRVNLIAEHGATVKKFGMPWQDFIFDKRLWKENVKRIMETYVKRCVNSAVEEKRFSLVWHYRNANPEQGKLRAGELFAELNQYTHNLGPQVIMGNKIVEVRNRGVDKGKAVHQILSRNKFDFILAAGDDATDEDLFRALGDNDRAFTFKVGSDASFAKYNLHTPQLMISMLHTMSQIQERSGELDTV